MFKNLGAIRFSAKSFASKTTVRSVSQVPSSLYQNVWKKSNIFYLTYIVAGCVVLEGVYGTFLNLVWDYYNAGKLYKQIDWSKFKTEDDE